MRGRFPSGEAASLLLFGTVAESIGRLIQKRTPTESEKFSIAVKADR